MPAPNLFSREEQIALAKKIGELPFSSAVVTIRTISGQRGTPIVLTTDCDSFSLLRILDECMQQVLLAIKEQDLQFASAQPTGPSH